MQDAAPYRHAKGAPASHPRLRHGPAAQHLTGPSEPNAPAPSLAISDAAHGGMPHFSLLPPLASQPVPSGAFDATLAPIIEICALGRSACGSIIATYTKERGPGGEVLRVDPARELYEANWRTGDSRSATTSTTGFGCGSVPWS
jgi:hypothetical protein